MPSRRRLIAVGATLLATGCLGSTATTTDREPSRRTDLPQRTASETPPTEGTGSPGPDEDRCTQGVTVSARSFETNSVTKSPTEPVREVVETAADEGRAEVTTYRTHPIDTDWFVALDEAFYRLHESLEGVESIPALLLDVSWERGRRAPDGATVVAYGDLPAVDRDALSRTVYHRWGHDPETLPTEGLSMSDSPAPYPDGLADSRLAEDARNGDVLWVRWENRQFRVSAGAETTTEQRTYEYTVERVAENESAFRDLMRSRYGVSLDDFPSEEREIVESAVENGGYDECSPVSPALKRLRQRLSTVKHVPPRPDAWLVEFEGSAYRLSILGWSA